MGLCIELNHLVCNRCLFNFLTKFHSWLKIMNGSWSLDQDGNLIGREEKVVITEGIIGKETLLVPLLKITTNEEVETLEVVVVEVTLEVIEKEDTIVKTRETGPKRETGTVETEEDVAEGAIIIAVTTTTDNKVKDPKGIGRTRISHK